MELGADTLRRVDDCVGGVALREIRPHLRDEAIPETVADALVERSVSENRELVRERCDQDERDVAFGSSMQAGVLELLARSRERIDGTLGNDTNDDVARRPRLSLANRALDARVRDACHGVAKLTVGAFCAPAEAWKYGLAVKREPKRPTMKTVGAVWMRVSNACATRL